ncbi:MAG: HIT family protein, partial [Parcubacteria group bacterium]|nr:HIT family protein [Parcubacteria group bacterium]
YLTDPTCLFCKIRDGELSSNTVYEDRRVLAFLDIKPINPGHTLLVSKDHYRDLLDAPPKVLKELVERLPSIAQAVLLATGAHGFNVGINNGRDAGQLIPHLHFHIMPRHKADGHSHWQGKEYKDAKEREAMTEKIKTFLAQ